MQLDGLMNESDNFFPCFSHGLAAGQVGHVGAVIPFGFLNDYYRLYPAVKLGVNK